MPVTIRKPKTVEELFQRLRDIHADVQKKFHDEWDWMDADFCVEALKVHFADLLAMNVALDEALGPVTDEEIGRYEWGSPDVVKLRMTEILFARRARLSAPVRDPAERVTIKPHCETCSKISVYLDGERQFTFEAQYPEHAERYAAGLRLELDAARKAEG